ncbi:MAG: SDR family NAD(P)-dependent oxidoreductase [Halieaceae bacterium]|jgi:uncharacterized oxidoreductase|nr:SDR family NAD(P)-dependent oxidoreductase [Halieaceae bacterium]
MKLSGNTILITGGATGIGLAMAKALIHFDNRVLICGRRQEKLDEAKQQHPDVICFCCDVASADSRRQLIDSIIHQNLIPNILINNAAIMRTYDLATGGELDLARVEADLMTNFLAPVALIEQLLPLMKQQSDPAVINVTSPGGVVPVANVPIYCACKAALNSYTKSLRLQLGNVVEIIELYPPAVDTAMMDPVDIHKVSTDQFGRDFMKLLKKGGDSLWVGDSKYLKWINRIMPGLAHRLVNNKARMAHSDHP